MSITLEPIEQVDLTGEAHGKLVLFGFAMGEAITNDTGVCFGRLYLHINAEGDLTGEALPELPSGATGGFQLVGQAEGWVDDFGTIRSAPLRIHGLAFGEDMYGAVGRMRLDGQALDVAPPQQYVLAVEQEPVVSAWGDFEFNYASDTITLDEAATPRLTLVVRALLAMNDLPLSSAQAQSQVADQLALDDSLVAVLLGMLSDGLALNDTPTLTFAMVERAATVLLLTGQVTSYAEALQEVRSALVLGAALREFLLMQEGDTLALDGALTAAATYIDALLDALALDDVVSPVHTGLMLVDDQLVLGDAGLTESELLQLIHDALALSVSVSLDNGQYTAWTLNTDSGGVTTYDNYPFNSFAKIGGRYYGATSVGVYELAGDTDDGAPIAARLRLGMSEMGTRRLKAYSEVYVGYTGNGQLLLRVIFTDDGSGTKRAAEYRMKPRPAAGRRESRFEPGKGLQAVYFDFELENLEGADFDLSSVEFQPLVSNRRTRG